MGETSDSVCVAIGNRLATPLLEVLTGTKLELNGNIRSRQMMSLDRIAAIAHLVFFYDLY